MLTNRAQQGGAVMGTIIDIGLAGKGLITGAAKLAARNVDEVAEVALRQTGAGSGFDAADEAYDAIRASTSDVEAIARNTGLKTENVQNVKDHIFNNEHILDHYVDLGVPSTVGRFDSDPRIAEAWERLTNGTHTPADMDLLRHEAAEAWVEKPEELATMRPINGRNAASLHRSIEKDFEMPIARDGMKFLGSRTTGPTSHFLMVRFGEENVEPNFVSVDPNGAKLESYKIETLKAALATIREQIPVSDRYYPVEFGLTVRDDASEFHYGALLTDIFSEAKRSLP